MKEKGKADETRAKWQTKGLLCNFMDQAVVKEGKPELRRLKGLNYIH